MDAQELRGLRKSAGRHMSRCLIVVLAVMIGTQLVLKNTLPDIYTEGMKALTVSAAFAFAESIAVPAIWLMVATRNKQFLSTFHTACSGFRMLLVLAVLGIVCAVVGRDAMVPYVVIFMIYYLVLLIMHTVFFAKMTNKLFKK